jgi:hypothetical protein
MLRWPIRTIVPGTVGITGRENNGDQTAISRHRSRLPQCHWFRDCPMPNAGPDPLRRDRWKGEGIAKQGDVAAVAVCPLNATDRAV